MKYNRLSVPCSSTDSTKANRDTGLGMVLLALLLYGFTSAVVLLPIAIVLLLFSLLWPSFFRPVARPWLALSERIGAVMSVVILTGLFFLLVTPIGLVRRLFGADPMQLRSWRQGDGSVFRRRDHLFVSADLEKPY